MEFALKSNQGAYPCIVTADEDNGIYTIRKADTSGEVFNSRQDLVCWIKDNWLEDEFEDRTAFRHVLSILENRM